MIQSAPTTAGEEKVSQRPTYRMKSRSKNTNTFLILLQLKVTTGSPQLTVGLHIVRRLHPAG